MSTASEQIPTVSVPLGLFNKMALCYYGEGPRHPRSTYSEPAPSPSRPAPSQSPVGRNQLERGDTRMSESVTGSVNLSAMIPGVTPATPYARRLAGLGDVEQEIPGIDKPTGT